MGLPEPRPGLVFRYDYLWAREASAGRDHSKDRPACLVAASDPSVAPHFVVILAITHAAPRAGTVGIEIPSAVRNALGLDDAPAWVIVSEYNVDSWPNGGLASIPGRAGVFSYGFLPPGLFGHIKTAFLALAKEGRSNSVRR